MRHLGPHLLLGGHHAVQVGALLGGLSAPLLLSGLLLLNRSLHPLTEVLWKERVAH